MTSTAQKLSLAYLSALVVGSMVGAGIFSLPRTFGNATGPFGAIVAWCIAGAGMYTLAHVSRVLAECKPDLDAGVYAYARPVLATMPASFRPSAGLVGCIADVLYWVLIKAILGAFFPVFGDGNTVAAVLVSSVALWGFHFMILGGIKEAAAINSVVTVAKIVPIVIFVVILLGAFEADLFRTKFWGGAGMPEASLFEQVRGTMLVTVFVFIGVEGASVYSRCARKRSDVGVATSLGFAGVLGLMVLVSFSPTPRWNDRKSQACGNPRWLPCWNPSLGLGAPFLSVSV
ncbi:amino acid transporter [Sinorhizobium terangae]|uniref:amino acid permease n=1 Tax=Sinorhizobium terangae TaxID=110322 RepID=UPI00184F5FA6|nr:amino acid permease [Sinorhizobium terangae]MBB4186241.1 amino acid transporter [Sinorhizobium terangae]